MLSFFAVLSSIFFSTAFGLYSINVSAVGRRNDGFGAISGGGATSRLLFSYEEPYLSDILDFLFLPSHGAALHHLKVEVGGDGQSSEGVEPSHAHFEGDGVFTRGYEWRLMVEAKKRNPAILISALAWTWPGWLGHKSPWDDCPKSAAYLVAWVRAAREVHNVTIDYIDADWNERGWSAEFVLVLRAALVAGFNSVGIVCGDDAHHWSCSAAVAANATLRAAVVALGVHGPDAPDAVAVGTDVPLWGSEVHAPDPGGAEVPAWQVWQDAADEDCARDDAVPPMHAAQAVARDGE
jgi:galactosylceramidase